MLPLQFTLKKSTSHSLLLTQWLIESESSYFSRGSLFSQLSSQTQGYFMSCFCRVICLSAAAERMTVLRSARTIFLPHYKGNLSDVILTLQLIGSQVVIPNCPHQSMSHITLVIAPVKEVFEYMPHNICDRFYCFISLSLQKNPKNKKKKQKPTKVIRWLWIKESFYFDNKDTEHSKYLQYHLIS